MLNYFAIDLMKRSLLFQVLGIVCIGWVVVFLIDPLDPTTASTPFLLGIVLMALSLRQSTALVVVSCVVYSIFTVYALVHFLDFVTFHIHTVPHPYFWMFQRIGLFLVVCGMAIYLAYYRTDTSQVLSNVQNILAKLPGPVVISDAAGYIVYVNDALCAIYQKKAADLTGKRYVDLFMHDIDEGKAMRYYIELFGAESDNVHELELKPFDSATKIKARLTCLGSRSNRVVITLLANSEQAIQDVFAPAPALRA